MFKLQTRKGPFVEPKLPQSSFVNWHLCIRIGDLRMGNWKAVGLLNGRPGLGRWTAGPRKKAVAIQQKPKLRHCNKIRLL